MQSYQELSENDSVLAPGDEGAHNVKMTLLDAGTATAPTAVAERILIVEDDTSARVGLEQLVRSWGFFAESAGDFEQFGGEVIQRVSAVVQRPSFRAGVGGVVQRATHSPAAFTTSATIPAGTSFGSARNAPENSHGCPWSSV